MELRFSVPGARFLCARGVRAGASPGGARLALSAVVETEREAEAECTIRAGTQGPVDVERWSGDVNRFSRRFVDSHRAERYRRMVDFGLWR